MIARMWRGRIHASDIDAYVDYVTSTGLKDYRATPGNRGAHIFTHLDGDIANIVTLSFWESLEAIRAFAGDDVTRARYYPEDRRFLLDFPERVEHYDMPS